MLTQYYFREIYKGFVLTQNLLIFFHYNNIVVVAMSKKKRNVGRPRKYATDAERSKAYYYRKKAKMKELEEKLRLLEEKQKTKNDYDKISC